MAIEGVWPSDNTQSQDVAARVLAEKFKLSPDKAKRLIELYRVALAGEFKSPKKRHR